MVLLKSITSLVATLRGQDNKFQKIAFFAFFDEIGGPTWK